VTPKSASSNNSSSCSSGSSLHTTARDDTDVGECDILDALPEGPLWDIPGALNYSRHTAKLNNGDSGTSEDYAERRELPTAARCGCSLHAAANTARSPQRADARGYPARHQSQSQPDSRFPIPDSRFPIPDSDSRFPTIAYPAGASAATHAQRNDHQRVDPTQ
jgi:hypothetical protein